MIEAIGRVITTGITKPVAVPNETSNIKPYIDDGPSDEQQVILPFPIALVQPAKVNYISYDDSREEVLGALDRVWRSGDLFKGITTPDSNFYLDYVTQLTTWVEKNSNFLHNQAINGAESFKREFFGIAFSDRLSHLSKSAFLTQVLELRLMDVNITPVLTSARKNMQSKKNGYRNEIFAGWYLAKFIFNLKPGPSILFSHSKIFQSYKVNPEKHLVTSEDNYRREIDIHIEDCLVSVKSCDTKLSRQISDLFYIITKPENNLSNKISRLILVKTVEESGQLNPHYRASPEYRSLKNKIVEGAIEKISALECPEESKEIILQCKNKLLNPDKIEIFFLPKLEDFETISTWIKKHYEFQDKIS